MTSNTSEKDTILLTINLLQLDEYKRIILRSRFYQLFKKYKRYSKFYLIFFDTGRLIVTVGSISIPAILSVEYGGVKQEIYWLVWSISLVVSIINAYIALFKFDKKYYSNIAIIERLACEFWQYAALCGRYSGNYTSSTPTHTNQFTFFVNNIERYQMKNIEEIYITFTENKNGKEEKKEELVPSVSKKFLDEHKNDLIENEKNSIIVEEQIPNIVIS